MNIRFVFGCFMFAIGVVAQQNVFYNGLDVSDLCKNFIQWQHYNDKQIALYSNFEPLDENGQAISRMEFMQKLESGLFVCVANPLQMNQYRLFRLDHNANPGVSAILSEQGFNEIQNLKKEGLYFSAFDAFDLDGNRISNTTLQGKYVVIKCWYIHCPVCVKEFPEVNALATKYKALRDDVVFLSMAEESPEDLKVFLAKKKLDYLVIPKMKDFMNRTLGLNTFPTHFLLDTEGKIIKVVSSVDALEWVLSTYLRS
ncbi:TlpA disulfide reductase family protein [Flavobacterium sp.]|uniref:TlpA family protein disulfide reductase n=1 Tax=Flavobacterium sp. TaxID=239 RepID=UPI00260D889F|nr:TlpA disulfide reductase family protein [Flavobacterium sp.]